jgi:hypothetical protein
MQIPRKSGGSRREGSGCAGFFFMKNGVSLLTLRPFLMSAFTIHPAMTWFITGYFLFIPLFIAVAMGWIG